MNEDKRYTRLIGTTEGGVRIRSNEDGSDSRTIEGYAIVFGQESVTMWKEGGKSVVEVIDASAVSRDLLDRSDIKMTMFHDMGRLLARSKRGEGTLSYNIDDKGVRFEFDAPHTQWGDEALELVRNGVIDGCSFMFAADYGNRDYTDIVDTKEKRIIHVKKIDGIYDFTLTPDPAYPQTQCSQRRSMCAETERESQYDTEVAQAVKALRDAANEILKR